MRYTDTFFLVHIHSHLFSFASYIESCIQSTDEVNAIRNFKFLIFWFLERVLSSLYVFQKSFSAFLPPRAKSIHPWHHIFFLFIVLSNSALKCLRTEIYFLKHLTVSLLIADNRLFKFIKSKIFSTLPQHELLFLRILFFHLFINPWVRNIWNTF